MLTLRQSAFDRLETDLFKRLEQQIQTAERVPAAEVHETETAYSICLELPGVARDSIDVKATDRNLVISAERRAPQPESNEATEAAQTPATLLSEIRYGTWSRSFRFAQPLDRDQLRATYRDGILAISAAKADNRTTVSVTVES